MKSREEGVRGCGARAGAEGSKKEGEGREGQEKLAVQTSFSIPSISRDNGGEI